MHSHCFFKASLILLSFSVRRFQSILWAVSTSSLRTRSINLRSKSHSLGLAGSWWKFEKLILALKFTSWEDWSRFVLSLSGSLFANEFWMWGAWLWSATMDTFLIGMNPSLLLTAEECDFLKFTTTSIIVPTRQRNRIKPHNILCKLIIKTISGVWCIPLKVPFKQMHYKCREVLIFGQRNIFYCSILKKSHSIEQFVSDASALSPLNTLNIFSPVSMLSCSRWHGLKYFFNETWKRSTQSWAVNLNQL